MTNFSNDKKLNAGAQMNERRKLAEAKQQLLATLSGKSDQPKQNAASTPDEARASLVKTMSRGRAATTEVPTEESTVHYMTPSGAKIASTVTPGAVLKLNQARQELKSTMSFIEDATRIAFSKDELVKTMQRGPNGPNDTSTDDVDSTGITNARKSSAGTNVGPGEVFSGPWQITARGRTFEQLKAEEAKKAREPSSVPAARSGQTRDAQGASVASSRGNKPGGDTSSRSSTRRVSVCT